MPVKINGEDFKYIVVKRFKKHGHIFNGYGTGNQLIDEINCWEEYSDKPGADFLCPILKYFTSKSDKVPPTSETMLENVVIIAQKAVDVGDAYSFCWEAERLNNIHGYIGTDSDERYRQLEKFAKEDNDWWDCMGNPGNSGVIFDYNQNCYKAVFIDYAL